MADVDPIAGAWILYDPFYAEDRRHAERVRDARLVRTPFCGHLVMASLKAAGCYADALDAMSAGRRPDLGPLRATRAVRATYWLGLGRSARLHRHFGLARTAFERAHALQDPGRHVEQHIRYEQNLLFEAVGDLPAARAAIARCIELYPHWTLYQRLAHLAATAGDLGRAEAAFLAGVSTLPDPGELLSELTAFYRAVGAVAPTPAASSGPPRVYGTKTVTRRDRTALSAQIASSCAGDGCSFE